MITIAVCYWIDLSGVVTSIKRLLWSWVFKKQQPYQDFNLKPFDCSLCMSHHIMLIYLLCTSQCTLFNYVLVCILSFISANITGLLYCLKDWFVVLESKLNNLINKK